MREGHVKHREKIIGSLSVAQQSAFYTIKSDIPTPEAVLPVT